MKLLLALIAGISFAFAPASFAQCGGCKDGTKSDKPADKPAETTSATTAEV